MKRTLVVVLCAGFLVGSYATTSRILSMGKHDAFFMDETSIFRNPANINIYPNMLMGSYGEYRMLKEDTSSKNPDNTYNYPAMKRTNRDPRDPFFGTILTYSLKQSSEEGNQYPMVSFGAVFNRKDALLDLISSYPSTLLADTNFSFASPVGKVDLMAAYAFPNGGMIGVGTYLAFQNRQFGGSKYKSNVTKANLGLNWPVARSIDLEGSVDFALLNSQGVNTATDKPYALATNDFAVQADLRMFSALTMLNGDFVPHASFKRTQLDKGKTVIWQVAGGLGLNINIDKGFFWAGIEGLYDKFDLTKGISSDAFAMLTDVPASVDRIGGRVSFGIERNVVWDWFVVRVGGMKTIMYATQDANTKGWLENPEYDADDDMVGLGIGFNVENRLKFDILVAEDVVYTLTNLLSGPQQHVFTRIDATFSF